MMFNLRMKLLDRTTIKQADKNQAERPSVGRKLWPPCQQASTLTRTSDSSQSYLGSRKWWQPWWFRVGNLTS